MSKIGKFWTDGVAYLALVMGAGVSIAGNIADTFRARGLATDTLDIFLAAWWPAVVVLTVHLFVSHRWAGQGVAMQVLRWLGCLSIGVMAMRVSWVHLNDLMLSRGQAGDVAIFGPLAIDFLAIMATALILAGQAPRLLDRPLDMPGDEMDKILDKWVNPARVRTAMANTLDTLVSGEREPATITLDNREATFAAPESEVGMWERLESQFAKPEPTLRTAVPELPEPISAPPARQGRLSQDDSAEAWHLAVQGRANDLSAGDISELLAGWYGVSSRTIRRQGWWVPTMAGKLDSDAA